MKSLASIRYGQKWSLVNAGKSPIIEADMEEIIADAVKRGRLRATVDHVQAVWTRTYRLSA